MPGKIKGVRGAVAKVVDNTETTYHYDGPQVIAEYEDGTLVRKFIYGPGIDEPIIIDTGCCIKTER